VEVRQVLIDYTPRDAFKAYHESDKRFGCTVAHRRAGKTVARINKLIKAAATNKLERPRYGYLAPSFVQAKDIAWAYLKAYAWPILEATGGKTNESDLSITFGHNEATIRLYGAENANRMRGLYFDGIAIDEAQDIAPSVLSSVIFPALLDRKGWLDVSGTPKGWGNLLGDVYKRGQTDPEWFCQVLRASQTQILPTDELLRAQAAMPENEYLQEFECSFEAAITGAYYAKELAKCEAEGRICSVPYDAAAQVHTVWDLGIADSMSIWFVQAVGRELRVIDYLEESGFGLDHYAQALRDKGYLYGKHFGPHDIQVRELGTGKSRKETAEALGLVFDVVPNLPVADGISAARLLISRMWFDAKKCALGLDALKQYREKVDIKRQVSMGPLHDWTSHAADAFRYLAISADKMSAQTPWEPLQYPSRGIV
jgi:phage terminase large subunit